MRHCRTLTTPTAIAIAILAALAPPSQAWATMPPLRGNLPQEVGDAFDRGLFALPQPDSGLGTSAAQPIWRVPVILIGYIDAPLRYHAADFDVGLFDSTGATPTGSVYDYYRWASGGRIKVVGRVVATVMLPEFRSYYGNNAYGLNTTATPNNSYGAVIDALRQSESTVDWSEFDADHDGYVDMLWVVHAGLGGEATAAPGLVAEEGQSARVLSSDRNNLWSITTRMSGTWRDGAPFVTSDRVPGSSTQFMRIDRFSILPELSPFHEGARSEIGVYCHEFGHALGLPDLYDRLGTEGAINMGPGNWSLMSSGAYGTDGFSPQYPSHMGAWALQFLGWDRTTTPTDDMNVNLASIGTGSVLELWPRGLQSPEHFLVEYRRRESFDRNLPEEGLLIYHVDDILMGNRIAANTVNSGPNPALVLVEADGNQDIMAGRNRGDLSDPFPGSLQKGGLDDDTSPSLRTFSGLKTNLAAYAFQANGSVMQIYARVRAPGWLPPEEHTPPAFAPIESNGGGRTSGMDAQGRFYLVAGEVRDGRTQIVLRAGSKQGWDETTTISNSTGYAFEPALAMLPGGDLAVAWSDTRDGLARIFYRARVGGVWTHERALTSLPGECRTPSLASDAHGTLVLVFRDLEIDSPSIQLMRFTYFSPFATPIRITGPDDRPEGPQVVSDSTGACFILWRDRSTPSQRIWFSRYAPASGLTPSEPLAVVPTTFSESGFSALMAPDGSLHVVWQVGGPGVNQLHYQLRGMAGNPVIPDILVETQGELIQNPELARDPTGTLHLVYENSHAGAIQVLYKRGTPSLDWDAVSTEITRPEWGDAVHPQVLPTGPLAMSVLYFGYPDHNPHLMTRIRDLALDPPLAVAPIPSPRARFTSSPNPLRAGSRVQLRAPIATSLLPPRADVYDVFGRRIAVITLSARVGDRWVGWLEPNTTHSWQDGVYFARLRDLPGDPARMVVLR